MFRLSLIQPSKLSTTKGWFIYKLYSNYINYILKLTLQQRATQRRELSSTTNTDCWATFVTLSWKLKIPCDDPVDGVLGDRRTGEESELELPPFHVLGATGGGVDWLDLEFRFAGVGVGGSGDETLPVVLVETLWDGDFFKPACELNQSTSQSPCQ